MLQPGCAPLVAGIATFHAVGGRLGSSASRRNRQGRRGVWCVQGEMQQIGSSGSKKCSQTRHVPRVDDWARFYRTATPQPGLERAF